MPAFKVTIIYGLYTFMKNNQFVTSILTLKLSIPHLMNSVASRTSGGLI